MGARFTKWRAVYNISEKYPSKLAIKSNAHALARYAALVQEAKMVPIIEPEVLTDGEHNINKCYEVAKEEFSNSTSLENENQNNKIIIKDRIADSMFQQIISRLRSTRRAKVKKPYPLFGHLYFNV